MLSPFFRVSPSLALLVAGVALCLGACSRESGPTPKVAEKKTPAAATAPAPKSAPAAADTAPARSPEIAALDAALRENTLQRSPRFMQLFAELVNRDIEAALAYLREMPPGPARSQALHQVLALLGFRDAERALKLAVELGGAREDQFVFSTLFDRFTRENVQQAIARLDRVPGGGPRQNAIRAIMGVWVSTDFDAALAWAEALKNPRDREVALEGALQVLAQRDPQRATELAQKLPDGPPRERALFQVVQLLISTDPAAAGKLIPLMPPGDLQLSAACNLARNMAAQDPQAAIAWVNSLSIEYTRWMALTNVLYQWAQTDSTAAARYVLELRPGGTLDFIAPQMASILSTNPPEAIRWCEALPTPSAREGSMIMLASSWAQRAPRDAVQWAATLKDEPVRTNATTAAFSQWFMQDSPAASAWLEKANFSAATKSIMLRSHLIKP